MRIKFFDELLAEIAATPVEEKYAPPPAAGDALPSPRKVLGVLSEPLQRLYCLLYGERAKLALLQADMLIIVGGHNKAAHHGKRYKKEEQCAKFADEVKHLKEMIVALINKIDFLERLFTMAVRTEIPGADKTKYIALTADWQVVEVDAATMRRLQTLEDLLSALG